MPLPSHCRCPGQGMRGSDVVPRMSIPPSCIHTPQLAESASTSGPARGPVSLGALYQPILPRSGSGARFFQHLEANSATGAAPAASTQTDSTDRQTETSSTGLAQPSLSVSHFGDWPEVWHTASQKWHALHRRNRWKQGVR
eukprot:359590-Chlamydomonas_euryale.AAC.15